MIWRLIARLATHPMVTNWLIARAQRTPYVHITSADGQSVYMGRWWLFNPYPHGSDGEGRSIPWLPSVRIHHIRRADQDRDLHDHPWNARTIVLRGWYNEERPFDVRNPLPPGNCGAVTEGSEVRYQFHRRQGYTGRLLFGQYHRITMVPDEGVWTLFITGRKRGSWGFSVDGKKVPWRTYVARQASTREGSQA
jgi:hypothetical protein